jgi:hypothetical protein
MKRASYTDPQGRRWATMIPDDAPADDARRGIPAGPPSLDDLGLPLDIEVRLHNELHDRGLLSEPDAKRRPQELLAALQAAYRLDVMRLRDLYRR